MSWSKEKSKMRLSSLSLVFAFCVPCLVSEAHEGHGEVTYLGNEGLLVTDGQSKLLFDPFFHNDFGQYQLLPLDMHKAIMQGLEPYDDVDLVVVSHAHEDHFSAHDMLMYMQAHPKVQLVAPQQAVEQLAQLDLTDKLLPRITSIALQYQQHPVSFQLGGALIEAVRIPHAGWPGRAEVENLVYRISLSDGNTYIHMGDADPEDDHFRPYKEYWQSKVTDIAFPPYWFFFSAEGNDIINTRINTLHAVGVHVPIRVPKQLLDSGKDYFSHPGEKRVPVSPNTSL
jgi:L-ascorbate metabolism protein UlaG (beta-lactamase superfamily)